MGGQNEKRLPADREARMGRGGLWGLLSGVFLLSFSLLAFEITLTRILSVLLSYHYVFVVLSLALLGLGIGGIIVYVYRSRRPVTDGRPASMARLTRSGSDRWPKSATAKSASHAGRSGGCSVFAAIREAPWRSTWDA